VAGHADLDGTLTIRAGSRAVAASTVGPRFAVVRAVGGLAGRFRSVVAEGLEVVVSYDVTTCYVVASREKASRVAQENVLGGRRSQPRI
jgi:hypothetical protein